jgi:hypothetical protein
MCWRASFTDVAGCTPMGASSLRSPGSVVAVGRAQNACRTCATRRAPVRPGSRCALDARATRRVPRPPGPGGPNARPAHVEALGVGAGVGGSGHADDCRCARPPRTELGCPSAQPRSGPAPDSGAHVGAEEGAVRASSAARRAASVSATPQVDDVGSRAPRARATSRAARKSGRRPALGEGEVGGRRPLETRRQPSSSRLMARGAGNYGRGPPRDRRASGTAPGRERTAPVGGALERGAPVEVVDASATRAAA